MIEFELGKADRKKNQDDPLAASLGDLVNCCGRGTKEVWEIREG